MSKKIQKTKWFWPWQDQEEEKWLETQSQKGLHLVKPSLFGRYTFEQGEHIHYIYRLDFHSDVQKDRDAYIQIFEDTGWEYLGEKSWQYFRKAFHEGEPTEIFTDTQSKIKKYERLLGYYAGFWFILLISTTVSPIRFIDDLVPWLRLVLLYMNYTIFFISFFVMLKLYNRIKALKKNIKE